MDSSPHTDVTIPLNFSASGAASTFTGNTMTLGNATTHHSNDQPGLSATMTPSGFPVAGSHIYFPSPSGPCPGPNTVGPHRAAVASTNKSSGVVPATMSFIGLTYGAQPVLAADTTPPFMAHLPPG